MTFGLALVLAIGAQGADDGRLAVGRVELAGPLESAVFSLSDGTRTTLEIDLVDGERTEIAVPFAGRPVDGTEVPERVELTGEGRAVFLGWKEDDGGWEDVPRSLRGRPRPAVPPPGGPASGVALALVAGLGVLVVSLRRRAVAALSVGALGAAAVAALGTGPPPPPAGAPGASDAPAAVRVLEGDLELDRWLAVDAAREALAMPAGAALRVETSPTAAPLDWEVRRVVADVFQWRAVASARIFRFVEVDPGLHRLSTEANGWGALDAVWVRDATGVWSERGAWAMGRPLPGDDDAGRAGDGGESPPGWLMAGLPQGVGVLVARLSPGAWRGPSDAVGPDGNDPETWIRLVGFVP